MDNKWTNEIRRLWSNVKWMYHDPAHRLAGKRDEGETTENAMDTRFYAATKSTIPEQCMD